MPSLILIVVVVGGNILAYVGQQLQQNGRMAIRCQHLISFGEDTCRDTKKESSVLFVLSVCVRARVCMCVCWGSEGLT